MQTLLWHWLTKCFLKKLCRSEYSKNLLVLKTKFVKKVFVQQTQLHFTVESVNHVPGSGTFGAYGVNKEVIRNIAAENSLKPNGPDLNVFLTGTGSGGGTAWLSSICKKGHTKLKSSVTGWYYDDEYTAEIVAHEIGHNLGMYHDFSEGWGDVNKTTGFRQREEGVDCRGYMDYR